MAPAFPARNACAAAALGGLPGRRPRGSRVQRRPRRRRRAERRAYGAVESRRYACCPAACRGPCGRRANPSARARPRRLAPVPRKISSSSSLADHDPDHRLRSISVSSRSAPPARRRSRHGDLRPRSGEHRARHRERRPLRGTPPVHATAAVHHRRPEPGDRGRLRPVRAARRRSPGLSGSPAPEPGAAPPPRRSVVALYEPAERRPRGGTAAPEENGNPHGERALRKVEDTGLEPVTSTLPA